MGFDNECIINMQSLPGEYFCPVCRLLVYPNEALQAQCTHVYCKPCLTFIVGSTRACPYDGYLVTEADAKLLAEANKPFAEAIGHTQVRCLYHRSGCTWQGSLSDCISHCSGCAFGESPVVCNRCGTQIVHRQVQEHAMNCPSVQAQMQQSVSMPATTVEQAQAISQESSALSAVGGAAAQGQGQSNAIAAQPQTVAQTVQLAGQIQSMTPDQWYQQQQQYQQYYQQYPGYDPYQQQYQQYYPYQQQFQQQQHFQPYPLSVVQGQTQNQAYMQPQPQVQAQPPTQPQAQPPTQPQAQAQLQTQLQIQNQVQAPPQSQTQPQANIPQPHPHPIIQSQIAAQSQIPQQQQLAQPIPNVQPQVPPQAQSQNMVSVNSQPPVQPQVHPSVPYASAHSHPQPRPHAQPQAYTQHHLPYTNQPPQQQLPQPQPQQSIPHGVTGNQSYPQPHLQQPIPLGHPQAPPLNVPHHLQQPAQHPGQFPGQQPSQVRPSPLLPSHVPLPPTQQQVVLPSHAQHPNVLHHSNPIQQTPHQLPPLSASQHQMQLQQQAGHVASAASQPYMPQPSMQPPQSLRQQSPQYLPVYLQPQQNVSGQLAPTHQSQRPTLSNQGAQRQAFPFSNTGSAQSQIRPGQAGSTQLNESPNSLTKPASSQQASHSVSIGHAPALPPSGTQSHAHIKSEEALNIQMDRAPEIEAKVISQAKVTSQDAKAPIVNISDGSHIESGETTDTKVPRVENNFSLKTDDWKQPSKSEDLIHANFGNDRPSSTQNMENNLGTVEQSRNLELPMTMPMIKGGAEATDRKPVSDSHLTQKGDVEPLHEASTKQDGPVTMISKSDEIHEGYGVNMQSTGGSMHPPPAIERGSQAQQVGSIAGGGCFNAPSHGHIMGNSVPAYESSMQVPQLLPQGMPGPGLDQYGRPLPSGLVQARPEAHGASSQKHMVQPGQPLPYPEQHPIAHGASSQMHGWASQRPFPPPPEHSGRPYLPYPGHNQDGRFIDPNSQQGRLHGQMMDPCPRPHVPGHPPPISENLPQHVGKPLHSSSHPEYPSGALPGPGGSWGSSTGPVQPIEGRLSLAHSGGPVISLDEHLTRPSFMGPRPPVLDSSGNSGPFHGIGTRLGHAVTNPLETEIYGQRKPSVNDNSQPFPYQTASAEHLSFGQPPFVKSSMMAVNGSAKGMADNVQEPNFQHGFFEERFKHQHVERYRGPLEEGVRPLSDERLKPALFDRNRHVDRREFEEDLKQFPRPAYLDGERGMKYDTFFSSRLFDRNQPGFDKPPHVLSHDMAVRSDSRSLFSSGGLALHPTDVGERSTFRDSSMVRRDTSDFLRPDSEPGRHVLEKPATRSPVSEYPRFNSGRYESNSRDLSFGGQSRMEEVNARESRRFGEPFGSNVFQTSEAVHFGSFSRRSRIGEPDEGGNSVSHKSINDIGFSIQNDGGFFQSDMEPFDSLRKRKPGSTGWCRICKIDCETVERLELHSQTRDHQKIAMDMVMNIKRENAKRRQMSTDQRAPKEQTDKLQQVSYGDMMRIIEMLGDLTMCSWIRICIGSTIGCWLQIAWSCFFINS